MKEVGGVSRLRCGLNDDSHMRKDSSEFLRALASEFEECGGVGYFDLHVEGHGMVLIPGMRKFLGHRK